MGLLDVQLCPLSNGVPWAAWLTSLSLSFLTQAEVTLNK